MGQYYTIDNIHNVTFDIVIEYIEKVLKERNDFCHCNICVVDLIAYVLNNVKPFYTTSLLGSIYPVKKLEIENEIDEVVEKGIERIKMHPHHDDEFNKTSINKVRNGEKRIDE